MECHWSNCDNKCKINPRTGKVFYYCEYHRHQRNKQRMQKYADDGGLANERNKKYINNLRYKFLQMYGNKCACCGETYVPFLTLDHVRGDGKMDRTSYTGKPCNSYNAYRNAIKYYNPQKYQILCMNCNFVKKNLGQCTCKNRKRKYNRPNIYSVSL